MKAIRTFFRQHRDAFRSMRRSPGSTFWTIIMMILTLVTVGATILFMVNVEVAKSNVEGGVQIRAHIQLETTDEEIAELKNEILALDNVESVDFISKEEELESIIDTFGDAFVPMEGDANPFYDVFAVKLKDLDKLEETSKELESLDRIVEVNYGEAETERLLSIMDTARYILAALAAIMVVISVIRVSHSIRQTIDARQDDIEIMQLVGATNAYIKGPFVIEGMLTGLISGVISVVALYYTYQGLQKLAMNMTGMNLLVHMPLHPVMTIIGIIVLVLGVFLGVTGANRSVKKHLNL